MGRITHRGVLIIMGDVVQFGSSPLPDMTVVELAIVIALLRDPPGTLASIAPILADWFRRPVSPAQLLQPSQRMLRLGWIESNADGTLIPGQAAFEPTAWFYAGFIRMLGSGLDTEKTGLQLFFESLLPKGDPE